MSAQPLAAPSESIASPLLDPLRGAAVVGLAAVAGHAKLTAPELQAVRGDAWFASLGTELQHAILARATVRRLRAGAVLIRGGSGGGAGGGSGGHDAWYGVAAGAVRLSTSLASGRQVNFQLVEPGAWFGDIPLIDGLAAPCDAETCADSTLLVLRKEDLLQLLARHADFGIALARLNGRRTRALMGLFADALSLPLENRLARQLLQLARRFGTRAAGNAVRIGLKLSQQDLADLLGASRQRVNAGLKRLERDGVLWLATGRWEVLDLEALEVLADPAL
jgi:CRP/FNR family transcriptional regulator, cyclic AMP receptor protein